MVIKNSYIIGILVSLSLLIQFPSHSMARRFAIAGFNRNRIHNSSKTPSRRNQRSSFNMYPTVNKKMHVTVSSPVNSVHNNNMPTGLQSGLGSVKENPVVQPHVEPVKSVIPSIEKPSIAVPIEKPSEIIEVPKKTLTDKDKSTLKYKPVQTQNNDVARTLKRDDYHSRDPYAGIKNRPFNDEDIRVEKINKNNKKDSQSVAMPVKADVDMVHSQRYAQQDGTDLFHKRLKEFNDAKEKYSELKKQLSKKADAPVNKVVSVNKISHDEPQVTEKKENIKKEIQVDSAVSKSTQPFQVGEVYAKIFGEKVDKQEVTNNKVPNSESVANASNTNNNVEASNEQSADISNIAVNTTSAMYNGIHGIWQYGKEAVTNAVKGAWNKCTSYDFWLKPYEMFSDKCIQKDPKTNKDVEVIRGNLHAFFLKNIKGEYAAHTAYYLTRMAMVILGMSLFYNPSLITNNGMGKVTVQLFSCVMQLVTGGSLASVVGMLSGKSLSGLKPPAELIVAANQSVAPAVQASANTWGSWARWLTKSIGTLNFLSQLSGYTFTKPAANSSVADPNTANVPSKDKPAGNDGIGQKADDKNVEGNNDKTKDKHIASLNDQQSARGESDVDIKSVLNLKSIPLKQVEQEILLLN